MGVRFGIVAVKADVAQLVEAFSTVWPTRAPKLAADLLGLDALWGWMETHKHPVSSRAWSLDNPGTDAYGFWQDGDWAVMWDPDFVQASDSTALAALSVRFGVALSFVVETSSGCAFFGAYAAGESTRTMSSISGEITTQGQRLPEEAALPECSYYMDETEQLQRAFGITPLEDLPADQPVRGAAYLDRTDYTALRQARALKASLQASAAGASLPVARRPWWRFW